MPPNPPELPEPASPQKWRWRRGTAYFGLLMILGAVVMWLSDYGSPEKLSDGTAEITWLGILQLSLLFGGCAVVFLADSPWTLFQIVLMFGGGILGSIGAEAISDSNTRAGGVGGGLGFVIGAGAAFVATWGLSRLFDLLRRFKARH